MLKHLLRRWCEIANSVQLARVKLPGVTDVNFYDKLIKKKKKIVKICNLRDRDRGRMERGKMAVEKILCKYENHAAEERESGGLHT